MSTVLPVDGAAAGADAAVELDAGALALEDELEELDDPQPASAARATGRARTVTARLMAGPFVGSAANLTQRTPYAPPGFPALHRLRGHAPPPAHRRRAHRRRAGGANRACRGPEGASAQLACAGGAQRRADLPASVDANSDLVRGRCPRAGRIPARAARRR